MAGDMAGVPALDRLLRLAIPEPNTGCLLWLGSVSPTSGYGTFRLANGRRTSAHRAAYILAYGEIEDDIQVCHTCDVKLCIEPTHLFIGSQQDNMQDASEKDRVHRPTIHGFPYGVGFHRHLKRRPYHGRVTFRGHTYSAGYYATPEDASAAAVALRDRLRAEYAAREIN